MAPAATGKPLLNTIGIPNGSGKTGSDSASEGRVASPTDSENAEKMMAALDAKMNSKLEITTDSASAATAPPAGSDSDPLSATALTSPLHNINWNDVRSGRSGSMSLNSIANNQWTSSSTSSWEMFKRTGPVYPPSLEKLIMDYHHRHGGAWQLVHDMGSGSGVYSAVLARYFRHVHVSDSSASGLSKSRQLLSTWAADNKKSRGRFTFSNGKPEQGHEAVADKTVDMAIILEGAHFTNPEMMVRSAAQTLSKDGTLALVNYSPICHVHGNPAANDAVQRLFKAWGTQPWDVVSGDSRGKKQFSTGMDFVPLPEDLFDQSKTRRITINTAGKGSKAFQVPGTNPDASDNKVTKGERTVDHSSENAEEPAAKGWRQDVGPEFFRSMTAALVGQGASQQFEKNFEEIQKIVYETSPNGLMITVEWTVAILLAKRK